MKVDKQNKKVAFSEETHTYWDVDTNDKYISVTTFICPLRSFLKIILFLFLFLFLLIYQLQSILLV